MIFRKSDFLALARSLFPFFLIGLGGAVATGVLLVAAGPMKYYTNALFPLKLGALAAALAIHLAIYPGLIFVRESGGFIIRRHIGALLATLSILLWFGVAILGRWLGLI